MFEGEGEPKRRAALGVGAAEAAPTAPHATPAAPRAAGQSRRKRTGPERFWRRRSMRLAFVLSLVVSGAVHYAAVPFELPHGFEVNDVEGEAAIPIDVLTAEAPPPEPPPPPPSTEKAEDDALEAKRVAAAAAAARRDAGTVQDAAAPDAGDAGDSGAAAASDAAPADAGSAADAGAARDAGDNGAVAFADAGSNDMVGGAMQADVVLVLLVVNAEVIRQHPVGARMGSLLRGIPQWDEFMSGTDIEPVRDADWVQVSGPSLINTARDVVLIHYSVADAVVDHAVAVVAHKYDRGGAFDAGVPGVKASLAHADRAERVLLRAQPHVLAVVPPSVAEKVARQLVSSRLPQHNHPGDAVYLRLLNPHHPMPEIPETITTMRLRVVPRADLGADVLIEGDTKDAATAIDAAGELRRIVRRHDDAFTAMLTHGLLDRVDVTSEGPLVMAHLVASLDQIETVTALVSSFLGVELPPAAPGAGPPRTPAH